MALNIELVDVLLKEQEEALSTVHRCQSQITPSEGADPVPEVEEKHRAPSSGALHGARQKAKAGPHTTGRRAK